MKTFLFVCVENAGRSQMAEAFAKHYGKGRLIAESAGAMPGKQVNPMVVQVMKEKGIDISRNQPKIMDLNRAKNAVIITMGWRGRDLSCSVTQERNRLELGGPEGQTS